MHLCQQEKAHSTFAFACFSSTGSVTKTDARYEAESAPTNIMDKKEDSLNFPLPILLIIILMIPITALGQVEQQGQKWLTLIELFTAYGSYLFLSSAFFSLIITSFPIQAFSTTT